jgi:hypothetical protein
LDLFSHGKWRGPIIGTVDYDWCSIRWTCSSKNLIELECAVVVMHESLSWTLGEEEGLFGDLTGRSSGRWSDGCSLAVRRGSSGDLSYDESKFLCKRNTKEDGE